MEDRDRLRQRQGQVKEQRRLPRHPGGLQTQLPLALRRRMRLSRQKLGVQIGRLPAAAGRAAQLGAVRGLPLTEEKIVRFPLDRLAVSEAERLRARSPPAAGGFTARLRGLHVIARRALYGGLVDLLPDVVQVIALGQGRDYGQGLPPRHRGDGIDHGRRVVHGCDAVKKHASMVTKRAIKRAIKIRNEARS